MTTPLRCQHAGQLIADRPIPESRSRSHNCTRTRPVPPSSSSASSCLASASRSCARFGQALGLRQALPPLLPGRVQRLVSRFPGLLHRFPAHIAQGSGTLLFGPEQHRIPPRIVRCLAPHVSQPLLVLGVTPDPLGPCCGSVAT